MTDFTNFLTKDTTPDDRQYDYDKEQLESLCSADVDRVKLNDFRIYKNSFDCWVVDLNWTDYTQMYAGGDFFSITALPLDQIQSCLTYEQRLLFHFHIKDLHKRVTIQARNLKGNYNTFEAILKGEC